jgi:hypothetical protein
MRILKFLLSGIIFICFVIPGIPCYLGVIYLIKKLYDYYQNNLTDTYNNSSIIQSNQNTDETDYKCKFN